MEKTVSDWIRHGIETKLGIRHVTYDELVDQVNSKLCPYLMILRRNRLMMGFLRYEQYGKNSAYDAIGSAITRLTEYRSTLNRELLVDAMNLIEIEWIRPLKDGAHWAASDDGEHVQEIQAR